jgi:hypothetical protein
MNYFYTIRCSECGVTRSHPIEDDTHLSAAQVLSQATHGDDCEIANAPGRVVEVDASNAANVIYTIS